MQFLGGLDSVGLSDANPEKFPALIASPPQDRTANSAPKRVRADGIQRIGTEHRDFVKQRVAAVVCIHELAGDDTGKTVIDKPDNR